MIECSKRKINDEDGTVESNSNNSTQSLRFLTDPTDSQGIRRIELQTTATGNDHAGYKAAEREAHSWFFANYYGRRTEESLASSHPVIETPNGTFMFGHHTGINPSSPTDTWGFHFEVVPIRLK